MRRRDALLPVLIAALGLLAPPQVRAADPRAPMPAAANPAAAESLVVDVELQGGGDLTGQVVGQDGKPMPREMVYLLRQGAVVSSCQTDDSGRFAIAGLSGGVYEVRFAQGGLVCRLWAPQTAPPSAKTDLLLTANSMVVRGQTGHPNPGSSWLKGPLPWIAAGVVITGAIWWDVVKSQDDRFRRDHPPAS